jgi:predicted dehydrogenase
VPADDAKGDATMERRVDVGMIGTSWYADRMHLPALKSHDRARIVAICGRNQVRAGEMAAKYAIPRVFSDYRELLRLTGLDAVVIAVPDDLHFPIAMAALDAGLHVLCEKPLALSLRQAEMMQAKAEAAGVKNMTYFTWRWVPHIRHLCRLVDEGYIGRCYDAQFHYSGSYARESGYRWKWDRAHGLGVLGDLGSHMIDLSRVLVGEIAEVQASLSVRVDKPAPDGAPYEPANDSASLMARFANGATGTFFLTAVADLGELGQEHRIVLYGDRGTLEAYADASIQTVRGMHDGGSEMETLRVPESILQGVDQRGSLWREQFPQVFTQQPVGTRLFIDSIVGDNPVSPSFNDGAKAQAVIEAAFESDASGCWAAVR